MKQSTRDASLEWFAVGDYKKSPNLVGGRETAKPKEVASRMKILLSEWERENGYLMDTCLNGQDTFRKLMSMFDIQS